MKLSVTRSRVLISRCIGLIVLFPVLFTASSFEPQGPLGVGFELVGFLLLTVAALGRLWALLYISGHKNRELIRTGPYSMMRHPLYFFSFIGVLGIGLVSENLLVLGVATVFYLSYYPFVILSEEKKLITIFGRAYLDYRASVPALWPRGSLYETSSEYNVNMREFLRRFGDATWFLWVFIPLHGIQALQHWGLLPILWTVP